MSTAPMSHSEPVVPECLTRDNLSSPYFPTTSRAMLWAVVSLCLIFAFTSLNRLNHTDLWGHLDFGRWMAEHGALPKVDPFTATENPATVLNSAWLSQLLGYLVQTKFGNEALVLGHAVLVTLTGGILMLAARKRGVAMSWIWTVGILYLILDLPIAGTIRPQLFGQLGAALFILAGFSLLDSRRPLIWLPIVAMFWANLHGSIVMGLAILGCFVLGEAWDLWQETAGNLAKMWADKRLQNLMIGLALAAAGACLNPEGPLLLVKAVFFAKHSALGNISEWRSLSADSGLTASVLLISAFGTVALWKYSPRKCQTVELLVVALFGILTFFSIRMLAWYALVWPVAMLPHLLATWEDYQKAQAAKEAKTAAYGNFVSAPLAEDVPTSMQTLTAIAFVFATCIFAPPTYSVVTGNTRGEALVNNADTPIHMADEICRRQLTGNFAAQLDWADYFVWKRGPEFRPMVYGHVHLADPAVYETHSRIFAGISTSPELLRKHQIRYLIVNPLIHRNLMGGMRQLSQDPKNGITLLYQDQKSFLFEISPVGPAVEAKAETKAAVVEPASAPPSDVQTTPPATAAEAKDAK